MKHHWLLMLPFLMPSFAHAQPTPAMVDSQLNDEQVIIWQLEALQKIAPAGKQAEITSMLAQTREAIRRSQGIKQQLLDAQKQH